MSNKRSIFLSPPTFDQGLIDLEKLDQPEQVIRDFESAVSDLAGRKYGVALHSGTASIHLAVKVLGIQKGDIVLCQSFTYAATAFPICYEGAIPVFIDSEPDTWNMDPELLEKAIKDYNTNRSSGGGVKAIMLVDLYGMPANMNKIMEIAGRHEIPVIEDAAEALGSTFEGIACGTFGHISIFSFNSNKIVTSSGGGMLLTDLEEYAQKACYYATQAKDPGANLIHREIGHNYRMSHVNAAIGNSQFRSLQPRIRSRRSNHAQYEKLLGGIPGISFLKEPEGAYSNRWLTTILIDPQKTGGITREDLRLALEADNIEARPLWKPMHLQPVFKDCKSYTNGVSESLFEQGLCLPSGSNLTEDDLNRIAAVIKRIFPV